MPLVATAPVQALQRGQCPNFISDLCNASQASALLCENSKNLSG